MWVAVDMQRSVKSYRGFWIISADCPTIIWIPMNHICLRVLPSFFSKGRGQILAETTLMLLLMWLVSCLSLDSTDPNQRLPSPLHEQLTMM